MALSLGSLTGFLDLDASAFESSLSGAGDKLKDFGGKGAAIAAGAGLAVGAALAAGVLGSMNVEAANDKMAAQLGLNAAESERLGGVAGSLYANAYGGSLEEVNTAVGAVVSSIAGMRTASSADVEAMTAKVLDLAATFEVDVGRASQVAGQMITSGLAKDGAQAMDLLTASMQAVPAAVREDLLDAVDEYGPFMQSIGIEGEAAMGLLVASAEKGAFGIDKTGDALKEFTIRATDMSSASKVGYDALGMSQEDMTRKLLAGGDTAAGAFAEIVGGLQGIEDPAAQSQAALALFGTPLEDLSVQEIPAFLDSLTGAQTALGDTAGAADAMGDTLNDNASTNIEAFKRGVMTTFVDVIGGKALPIVDDIASALATGLGPAFDVASSAAKSLGSAIPTPILKVAAVVIGVLTGVLGVQKAATVAASIATGAYTAVKSIFITTTNAETGAVTLSTVARVRGTVATIAGTVATGASIVAHGIARAAIGAWTAAQWLLNAALTANPIGLVIAVIALLVAGLVIAYRESETFRNIVNGAFDAVKVSTGIVVGFMIDGFRGLLGVWLAVAGGIVSGAATALGWVPGVGDKLKVAETAFNTMKDGILGTLDDAANKAYGFGEKSGANAAGGLRSRQGDAFNAGAQVGNDMGRGVGSAGGGAFHAAAGVGDNAQRGMAQMAGAGYNAGARVGSDMGRGVGAGSGQAWDAGVGVGVRAGDGLVAGLNARQGAVAAAAQRLAITAGRAMAGGLQERSPSRVTMQIGAYAGEGLALGMLAEASRVAAASGVLAMAAVPSLGDIPRIRLPAGSMRGGDGGSQGRPAAQPAPVMGGVTYNGPVYVVDPDRWAQEQVNKQRDAAAVHGLAGLVNV